MLRDVVRNRTGHGILQQSLVCDQAFAVNRLHLRRVKIHRHHADQDQHAENDVQNRNAIWQKSREQLDSPAPLSGKASNLLNFTVPGMEGMQFGTRKSLPKYRNSSRRLLSATVRAWRESEFRSWRCDSSGRQWHRVAICLGSKLHASAR